MFKTGGMPCPLQMNRTTRPGRETNGIPKAMKWSELTECPPKARNIFNPLAFDFAQLGFGFITGTCNTPSAPWASGNQKCELLSYRWRPTVDGAVILFGCQARSAYNITYE